MQVSHVTEPSAEKVVIVTGSSRGLGFAIATFLLNQDINVIAVARNDLALAKLQSQWPNKVELAVGDITEADAAQRAVGLALKRWGRLDGVIVNHGTLEPVDRIIDVNVDEMKRGFDINFFSAVSLTKSALPHLRKARGAMVFISSGAAVGPYESWGTYGATKAAINHLVTTLAVEEPDLTLLSIRPGVIDTEMQRDIREKFIDKMGKDDAEKFEKMKREGKLLQPEQPGNVVARLVLDPPQQLSGKFLSWNADELQAFQD